MSYKDFDKLKKDKQLRAQGLPVGREEFEFFNLEKDCDTDEILHICVD